MLSTILELIGMALIVAGVALLNVPAATIVAGVMVLAVSYLGGDS